MPAQTVKFRTQFNKGNYSFKAPTGEKVEMRHRAKMHSDGRRELIKDKAVAIYDLIQASREQCEIELIVKRAVEGDYNALNAIQGMYADITNCPNSLAEAQQFIIDAKADFDRLPKEIRAKFENNAEIYVAEMSRDFDSWSDKMGYKAELEKQKAAEKAKVEFNENFTKAVANLAQGTTVTQKGVEDNE